MQSLFPNGASAIFPFRRNSRSEGSRARLLTLSYSFPLGIVPFLGLAVWLPAPFPENALPRNEKQELLFVKIGYSFRLQPLHIMLMGNFPFLLHSAFFYFSGSSPFPGSNGLPSLLTHVGELREHFSRLFFHPPPILLPSGLPLQ